ncbi:MAG TPA: Tim44/TimA family putative adaptor protein [Stellaceae bacterium]|nr:Tim44/TimA family putative adaptor protein [Stellaceae bacterium]
MDSGFQLYGILLFAAIAGILLVRLWSVLGKRTGTERRIDPFAPPPPRAQGAPPGIKNGPFAPGPVIEGQAVRVGEAQPAPSKTPGAQAAKAADPGFDEQAFLAGARGAFAIVVNAFAAGDSAALQPLLSPEVFEQFSSAIRARRPGQEKEPSPLVAVRSAAISASAVEGMTSMVTVKFVSDQKTGKDGAAEEHVDFWTFSRGLKSRDPNWTLIATKGPDAA